MYQVVKNRWVRIYTVGGGGDGDDGGWVGRHKTVVNNIYNGFTYMLRTCTRKS